MVRNLLTITASSSSSILTHHNHHNHNLFTSKHPLPFSLYNPISLSLSKPTSPTPPHSSPSLTSPQLIPPNGPHPDDKNTLKHYAEIASNHVGAGRFEDFGIVVDTVVGSGGSGFVELLDMEVVLGGVAKGLSEGRIRTVVGFLRCLAQLGVDVTELYDVSSMELFKGECLQIVNSRNLREAVWLMEALAGIQFPIKELVEPDTMIRRCIQMRSPGLAVRYAYLLPHAEILFCTIIREFGKKEDLASAMKAFEASKQKMSGHNMYVYRSIIDVCGQCGDSSKSRVIYESLMQQKVTPNIYVFNSLMNVNAHDLMYTMDVYKQMQNLGVVADMTSYNILLKACCVSGRVDLAQDIYKEVKQLEATGALKMDVFTYSTIIKVFADAKLWQMATKIKEDMLSAGVTPNTVTWSSLISACAKAGVVDQATQLFEEMLNTGCQPNSQCFNTLLHACVEANQYDRAFRLFHTWKSCGPPRTSAEDSKTSIDTGSSVRLKDEDCSTSTPYHATASRHLSFARSVPFKPTTTTYNILLKACGVDFYRANALIAEMKVLGLSPNQISWSILMDICGRRGNVEGSLQILKYMGESGIRPDVVAYTTAIKICVESKKLNSAFSLFAEMKRNCIKPNLVTYNTLLRARSRYGSLQEVQQCLAIYQHMRKAGYKPNDYYVKQLIEEWCEEVIQMNNQGGQSITRDRTDIGALRSLLLERVATHLQKNAAESLAVDIQGLTKVEARLVVLAVLRMIKENYNSGHPVEDDLTILIGITRHGTEYSIKDGITDLLNKELGIEVSTGKPMTRVDGKTVNQESAPSTDPNLRGILRTGESSSESGAPTRRPAVLERILVSRKSLYQWLRRKPRASNK